MPSGIADSDPASPLVEVRALRKRYGEGEAAVEALRSVDLTIQRGEMIALMGPSGSGKSTLMHILGLLDRATDGNYALEGEDMTRQSAVSLARLRGKRIAFVFQGIHLLPRLNAVANVELPMAYARRPLAERRESALSALQAVGVGHLADRYPPQMSGGQAQRVAIARAVAPEPDLLLADEPTGALDRRSGRAVLALFQGLHTRLGLTIVLVTHDPFVARHTERIVQLEDGRIVDDSPVADRIVSDEATEPEGIR